MDLTRKFEKNENIVYREEDDGAFLFDPDTGNLKYMNRSGKEAFLMLNSQRDVNSMINGLVGLFPNVKRQQIENDLEAFLKELEENAFISPQNRE